MLTQQRINNNAIFVLKELSRLNDKWTKKQYQSGLS